MTIYVKSQQHPEVSFNAGLYFNVVALSQTGPSSTVFLLVTPRPVPGNSTSRDAEDAQVYSSTTLQLNKSCLCITALLRGVPGEPQAKGDHVTVQRSKLVA